MPLTLMYITNNPQIALIAQKYGVERIWIDLETLGKEERQGKINSVKSHHSIEDIRTIAPLMKNSEMLVRVNPINPQSKKEIEQVINAGADIIMLPMWKTVDEVKLYINLVGGRVKTTLLLETREAVDCLDDVLTLGGFDEIHIGLNDLHSVAMLMQIFCSAISSSMNPWIYRSIKSGQLNKIVKAARRCRALPNTWQFKPGNPEYEEYIHSSDWRNIADKRLEMAPTAMLFVHNPLTIAIGDSEEMQKAIEMLAEVKESILNAYQIKTNLSRTKLSNMMDGETWLSAHKAIELGFADGILEDEKKRVQTDDVTYAFSRHAVTNSLLDKLKLSRQQKQPVKNNIPTKPVTEKAADTGVKADDLYRRLSVIQH